MSSGSQRKMVGALTIAAIAASNPQPTSLPTINAAAQKRKTRRISKVDDQVELTDNDTAKPARKRARTKRADLVENGKFPIIPPDEVKIRQIQVIIIARPIVVDLKRLKEQIMNAPWEVQEMIRNQCIKGRDDNMKFIKVFLCSRELQLHNISMYQAIAEKEVVLTGKNFLYEFGKLHPAVVAIAKKLKVVYITSDAPVLKKDLDKRMIVYNQELEQYNKYQRLYNAGIFKLEFCLALPPLPLTHRHKMYPMAEPHHSSSFCGVLQACRKFISVNELTLDLSGHINYSGVDRLSNNFDPGYGSRVEEHLFAATGFRDNGTKFTTPKLAQGLSPLKKLTLVLGTAECCKAEIPEDALSAAQAMGIRGHPIAPTWQCIRHYFNSDFMQNGYNPKIHAPLTEFSMDKEAGIVCFKRAGYKGFIGG